MLTQPQTLDVNNRLSTLLRAVGLSTLFKAVYLCLEMSSLSSSGCGNVVLVVTKLAHPSCLEKAKAKAKRRTKGKEAMKKKKPTASMLILQAIHVLGLTEAAPGGGGVADESVKKLIPHTVLSPSSWATTIQRMRNKGDLAPRQPEPGGDCLMDGSSSSASHRTYIRTRLHGCTHIHTSLLPRCRQHFAGDEAT